MSPRPTCRSIALEGAGTRAAGESALAASAPPLLETNNAFLSDFDGTLVELADSPEAILPTAGLASCLDRLKSQLGGAVAIVTGRRLAEVDRYLAPLQLIGAGAHGAELRWPTDAQIEPIATPLKASLVRNLEAVLADLQGVWVENKTYALAVHFRQNPGAALECRTRVERVAASFPQVKIFLGHAVVEVRSRECGKGAATRLLLSRPPFAGRIPMFVGDDGADEEAFLAVQAVGGHGIKVGCGETGAHYRLPDVAAVHRWIRDSLASA